MIAPRFVCSWILNFNGVTLEKILDLLTSEREVLIKLVLGFELLFTGNFENAAAGLGVSDVDLIDFPEARY